MKRVNTFTKNWLLSLFFLLLLSASSDADQNDLRLAELFSSLKSTESVSKALVLKAKSGISGWNTMILKWRAPCFRVLKQ